ncbi:MAG: SdiA-regulated domain-containing protein, partial [Bacteroidota bacterium]|nr:SdiA-regulated domain-containing protein [Bacteroidota bacterium]
MNFKFLIGLTFGSMILISACTKNQTKKNNSSNQKKVNEFTNDSGTELSHYDLASVNPDILQLPKDLKEISGMTMTPDGKLFAQQDESAIIYQIDLTNGNIIKKFGLGDFILKEDFEDIAYANNKFYMLKSSGDIYEFSEVNDKETADFKTFKTELNHTNDVEGLCFDPETNSLLLACKGVSGTGDNEDKAIYSFSLDNMTLNKTPRFILPLSDIKKMFNPSGIQRNPKTGSFFIISANGNEIIEISKEGSILGKHSLPQSVHIQPEGIVFARNSDLLISNEGKPGKGYI